MITTSEPSEWKDLQVKVAEILGNCGFSVQIEKEVKSARGKVELDVYAEEEIKGRKYTIACECKNWKAAIPQNVVHGFRSVVSDLGCNIGYIITTSTFQKGSVDTSDFTNIELLTWEEFQSKFFESWFEEFFIKRMTSELDPLMSYTEPILPKWFPLMSIDDKKKYYDLKDKYDPLGYIVMVLFSTYSRTIVMRDIPKLPLLGLVKDVQEIEKRIPKEILIETGYLEFMNRTIDYGKAAIAEFRQLRDKYNSSETDD